MNESPKLTDGQYRLVFTLIALAILGFSTGIPFLIPEKYHSYYALLASIIFLVDVLILPSLKKGRISEDEKRTYPFFVAMGLVLILVSSILLYMNIKPSYWMQSFVFPAGFFTSGVLFQYLRNRKIIP